MINEVLTHISFRRLELVSFLTGFCLLSYELAAARILAPSIGSSTYVWTSVIGVIIAALSLGFFFGGRIADTRARRTDLVWLLLSAASMAALTLVLYESLLLQIPEWFTDRRLQAVSAALLLFAPTSFFIGCTSPYLAKLRVASLSATGRSIASLDAFNAIGGIIGTFVTGFILFGFIGSHETISVVVGLLAASSWLFVPRYRLTPRLILTAVLLLLTASPVSGVNAVASIDTPSAHYKVVEGAFDGRPAIGLLTGPSGTQSARYLDGSNELVFWYTSQMAQLTIAENPESVLVLGGGAFTLPQYLAEMLPHSKIDVVEIDPELKSISEQYFGYRNPENVSLIFDDARTYINEAKKQYDVVIVDVYGDTTIPFSLTTTQYADRLAALVRPEGKLLVNLIAGDSGPCRDVFSTLHAAYDTQFPYAVYKGQPDRDSDRRNNIVVYSRDRLFIEGYGSLPVDTVAPFADNFAPAEQLYYACQEVQ
jgi:predicted membrane-bound spermidine synthase